MKKIVYALMLSTLIMGLAMVAPTYASAPPTAVTISQVMSQAPPSTFDPTTGTGTNYGTWTASGAFGDLGTAVEPFRLSFTAGFQGGAHFVMSEEILTSSSNSANTITILVNLGDATFISGGTQLRLDGNWQVASGTGAYQGLAGQGTVLAIIDFALADAGLPSNFLTYTGFAHLP